MDIERVRGKCCVCFHDLEVHLDEGGWWRCHSLGMDFYQCECVLRKDRAEGDKNYYDLARRIESNEELQRFLEDDVK